MSPRGRHGGPRAGRRPPWWPEDEPWPPGSLRRGRGSFVWRFGCFFLLVVLVVVGAATLVGWVAGTPIGLVALALSFVALGAAGCWFRRTGRVLDELVEATRRVENGDYAARVADSAGGPRPLRSLVRGFNTMAGRLEADERQRRTLLADVSHELRTPLAVIAGNLEAIIDGVHPADEGHLGAILDETKVLGRLVEDLRTLALAEGGTLTLHREPTDLAVLAREVAASFASSRGPLTTDAPEELPLLEVDPVRVREVLANLVANAVRATAAGGMVRMVIVLEPDGNVRVEVRDTGPGIAPELLPHVFDRFVKSTESSGSGLGLAIARNLVEAHGGTIGAENAPGGGTSVWFRLPPG